MARGVAMRTLRVVTGQLVAPVLLLLLAVALLFVTAEEEVNKDVFHSLRYEQISD